MKFRFCIMALCAIFQTLAAVELASGDYRAELHGERLRLLWKSEVLVDDVMPLLVSRNWGAIYANENYLGALKPEECKVDGSTLTVTRNTGATTFTLTVSPDAQRGFACTVQYHTPHPERLEMEQFFLMLPQQSFGKALCDVSGELKRLPPKLGFDPNRDSRERMSADGSEIRIFRNFGTVEFRSSDIAFFLYDARYHIWKGDTLRSFAVVANAIPDNQVVRFTLSVTPQPVPEPAPEALRALSAYTDRQAPAPRHVTLDEERSLDLHVGVNSIATDRPALVAVFAPGNGEPRTIAPAERFELPSDAAEIAFLQKTGDRIACFSEPVPVEAVSPAYQVLELRERLGALPESPQLKPVLERVRVLGERANTKLTKREFSRLADELAEIDRLTGKLELLATRGQLAAALRRGYFLYLTPSTAKIYHAAPLPADLQPGAGLALSGARNEYLNFQLTAVTLFEGLTNVRPGELRLRDASGKTLPLEVKTYAVEDIVSGADVVPDLLSKHLERSITTADNSQSWWINFRIPADLAPGDYTLEQDFQGETVRSTLHVYDFALEENFDAVAIVGMFPHELRALPDYRPEMEDEVMQLLIDHGFYATPGLSHPRYMDDFDYGLTKFARPQLKKFNYLSLAGIPYVEWLEKFYTDGKLPSGDAYREMVVQAMLDNAAQLKREGFNSNVYAYYDEVEKEDHRVLDFIRSVRDKSGVSFAVAFHKAAFGTDYVEFYANDVDLFYFSSAFLERPYWVDYIGELKRRGKKIGVYFNIVYPKQPTCNVIDAPALAHRTLFWTQWKYEIDYNLFWGINCWWANLKLDTDPQQVNNRGDGVLLYRDVRGGGYALSLRLEIMREGVQDYRYLRMLKTLRERSTASPELLREADDLLKINWLRDSQDVPLSDTELLRARNHIAELIELFLQD